MIFIYFIVLFSENKGSMDICYTDLASGEATIAYFLPGAPTELLPILDLAFKVKILDGFSISYFWFSSFNYLP